MLWTPARLLWGLAALSAIANIAMGLFPELPPPAAVAAIVTVPLFAFAVAHACATFGVRDAIVFALLCLVVSNAFENLSIVTGFPFGRYHYSDVLGPKLFLVPVLIGPAYVAMGYLSFVLARVILGVGSGTTRHALLTVPLTASVFMVCWNLSFEPGASTVRKIWIWQDGGSFFGVPLSNAFGWFLTAYLFLQLYALYLHARGTTGLAYQGTRANNQQAILVYASMTVMTILFAFTAAAPESVTDASGAVWRSADIYAACALACFFTMGSFVLLALGRMQATKGDVGCRQASAEKAFP
jgi:uncharacterized membrane protein